MLFLTLTPSDNLQQIFDTIHEPATIFLKNGTYNQKVVVKSDNIKIVGEDRERVVITNDDYAKKQHADGREYNTFRTYTLCIVGDGVVLENLTVENSITDPKTHGQCVALSVNAKNFYAKDVILKSTQDTLFTSPFPDDLVIRYSGLTDDPTYYDGFIPRDQLYLEGNAVHLFENCDIYGTVDFIFGCAEAYFKNCNLISIYDNRQCGYVAAPAHSLKQQNGYAFVDCNFVNGGAGDGQIYLARPWRDFGKCEYVNCALGSHISPLLFDKWNDTYRNKTARFGYFNLHYNNYNNVARVEGAGDDTVATSTTVATEQGKLAPVDWSKELSDAQAREIVDRCEKAFALFNKNYLSKFEKN
jgi:pectinesterase